MNLYLHLSIHIFLALLAGFIVWRMYYVSSWPLITSLVSGVAVDLDHLIDYYLAFGWSFNFYYFQGGLEFLKSNKMYTFFHGWEYVILFVALWLIFKNITAKTVFLSLALGLFFHLAADVAIDKVPVKSYSIIYKAKNNFDIEKLVIPEHWEKHKKIRKDLKFE